MDFRNNGEKLPVYNVLDGLLKGSLERLKTMRCSFSKLTFVFLNLGESQPEVLFCLLIFILNYLGIP